MKNELELYDHNIETYDKVKKTYESGENRVAILQATGTGKSFVSLQLAYDNRDKNIIIVVPSKAIKEHFEEVIKACKNISIKDFKNLRIMLYQTLCRMSRDDIKALDCDLLILDEIHHLGAPKWRNGVNELVRTHENASIFGMSAYSVRDRGSAYEMDVTDPNTSELFSGKVVSKYDICDAWIDEVLPLPNYKTAIYDLDKMVSNLESRINNENLNDEEKMNFQKILTDIKRRVHESKGIEDIILHNIKPNGKYIYFCPPMSAESLNDIETIKKEALEWFKKVTGQENIEFYTTTSQMGKEGIKNRNAFYNDLTLDGRDASNKLRVMFAINQYNEGIHAPNVDGVILGRQTGSDIVYYEQLGRALNVRGTSKSEIEYYHSLSLNELIKLCIERKIHLFGNEDKDTLIRKLSSPIIIDLVDNHVFIKELKNNLKNRIKGCIKEGYTSRIKRNIESYYYEIEVENIDIYETIRDTNNRLNQKWDRMYEYAKKYFEHYGNLDVFARFRTNDGYTIDENGKIGLGLWVYNNRQLYKNNKLSSNQIEKLERIGMKFENKILSWEEMYEYAKIYYEHYGNLEVPVQFRTNDGYTSDNKGKIGLGHWVKKFISAYRNNKLSKEKQEKLEKLGINFEYMLLSWDEMYKYAKIYYEYYGDLEVPSKFRTNDGYTRDENGTIGLGTWIHHNRQLYKNDKLSEEKKIKLRQIGFRFEKRSKSWDKMYEYAKAYYEKHGDLELNIDSDYNLIELSSWIDKNKYLYRNNRLSLEEQKKLELIGIRFEYKFLSWNEMYEYARIYYEHHGNLEVPFSFRTNNGYSYDENGNIWLGSWVKDTINRYKLHYITEEQRKKLEKIGVHPSKKILPWDIMYEYAKTYYEHHGDLEMPPRFRTNDGYTMDENGEIGLREWIQHNKYFFRKNALSKERIEKLKQIGMKFEKIVLSWNEMYEYAEKYYEHYGNLEVPQKFRTNDGYTMDENGKINLGTWIRYNRGIYGSDKQSEEQRKKLERIGMRFENKFLSWNEMYEYAKTYYEYHKDLEVPYSFRTNDGYTHDEKGKINLGVWISNNRTLYNNRKLSEERIKILERIGMRFENKLMSWDEMYEYAKIYYEHHGNSDVSVKFRTNDGYTQDKKGRIGLGLWIHRNRTLYKKNRLSLEQIQKLTSIKMRFNTEVDLNHSSNQNKFKPMKQEKNIELVAANIESEFEDGFSKTLK